MNRPAWWRLITMPMLDAGWCLATIQPQQWDCQKSYNNKDISISYCCIKIILNCANHQITALCQCQLSIFVRFFFIDNQIGEVGPLDQVADFERWFFLLKKGPSDLQKDSRNFNSEHRGFTPKKSWSLESWVKWAIFSRKIWTAKGSPSTFMTWGSKLLVFGGVFWSYSTNADLVLMNPVEMIKNI